MLLSKFRHRDTTSLIVAILISAFLLQVINQSVNLHTHILADGTVIIHAHPYHKTDQSCPVTNHTHTRNELLSLSLLQILFFSFTFLFFYFFKSGIKHRFSIKLRFYRCLSHSLLKNKAPPYYSTIFTINYN